MGGDIAGKGLVPIIADPTGGWLISYLGRTEMLQDDELRQFETDVRGNGMYPCRMSQSEADEIVASDDARDQLFERVMVDEARRWVTIAEEKLAGSGVRAFIMAGNDDPWALDEALASGVALEHCDDRIVQFDGYEMLSLGVSNHTPCTPRRELDEDALLERIEVLAGQLNDVSRSIFNLHVPPYASGLDEAPALDQHLTLKIGAGAIQMAPAGSRAVRTAIETYQPLLSLHGHIHESRAAVRIGRTLAVNPGSDYSSGSVDGCLITLSGDKVNRIRWSRDDQLASTRDGRIRRARPSNDRLGARPPRVRLLVT